MWAPQLDALSDEFRVVAPDLPGYGASPPLAQIMSMRRLADEVVALLDAIGVERATVVGLSMGGLVAMELGLGNPDRVDGLVLAATTAAPLTAEEAERRRATAAEIEAKGMLGHTAEMLPRLFGSEAAPRPGAHGADRDDDAADRARSVRRGRVCAGVRSDPTTSGCSPTSVRRRS